MNLVQLTEAEKVLLIQDEIQRTKLALRNAIHEQIEDQRSRFPPPSSPPASPPSRSQQLQQHNQQQMDEKKELVAALAAVQERRHSKEVQLKKLLFVGKDQEREVARLTSEVATVGAQATHEARRCRQLEHEIANQESLLSSINEQRAQMDEKVLRHRRRVTLLQKQQQQQIKARNANVAGSLQTAEAEDALREELVRLQEANRDLLEALSRDFDQKPPSTSVTAIHHHHDDDNNNNKSQVDAVEGDTVPNDDAVETRSNNHTLNNKPSHAGGPAERATTAACSHSHPKKKPHVPPRPRTEKEEELYNEFELAVAALLANIGGGGCDHQEE